MKRSSAGRLHIVMTDLRDRPDIVVLPPVLVGGALIAGLVIHYWIWTLEPFPVVVSRVVGVACFVAAGTLAHFAHRSFQRSGTNVLPTRPTLAIATDGPFRYTRNPLYIAAMGVYVGVSLWVDSGAMLALLPLVWAGLHWGVVLREEEYLERKFGAEYAQYRKRVRRWL